MKIWIIRCPFLPVYGMALFPVILVKFEYLKQNKDMINHEMIHIRQQLELSILPFYIIYLINYLFNLIIYFNHKEAYRNIVFEREAYAKDNDLTYLSRRQLGEWLRYFTKSV